jgi:hypothetical protein
MGYGVSHCPFFFKRAQGKNATQIGLMYVKRTDAHLGSHFCPAPKKTLKVFSLMLPIPYLTCFGNNFFVFE